MAVRRTAGGGAVGSVTTNFDPSTNKVFGVVSSPNGIVNGLTVGIAVDGNVQGTATTASDGSYSYTLTNITAGAHTFKASVGIPIPTTSQASATATTTVSSSATGNVLGAGTLAFGLIGQSLN